MLITAFGPFQIRQFKTNCNGLNIYLGSPNLLRHNIVLFYTRFCGLGLQTNDNGVISGT